MLKEGPGAVEITDSNGNSVALATNGVIVNASTTVTIIAGMVRVNTGMAQSSGVVQCDTLISNSVIGASYTPGAGNIL